jgi:hypothetical protein
MLLLLIALTWLAVVMVLLGACRAAAAGDRLSVAADDGAPRTLRPEPAHRSRRLRPEPSRSRPLQPSGR